MLHHSEPGLVYNIGAGNELENLTVATRILQPLGKTLNLIRCVQDRPGHDRRYAVDCARLRSLGWAPAVDFETGLRATVEWYRENETWWKKMTSGQFRAYDEHMYATRLGEESGRRQQYRASEVVH